MKKTSKKKMESKDITLYTIQDYLPKVWGIFACEENDVHYLIRDTKTDKISWKNLEQITDLRDMVVVPFKPDAKFMIASFMSNKASYPKNVDVFEMCELIPSFNENGYWYEDVTSKRIKVK